MVHSDFIIRFDPNTETKEDISKKILKSIILNRLKDRKPAPIGIFGESGEGKSYAALKIQEVLLEMQGLDIKDYLDYMNVYIPIQYPEKLDALLHNKELKKVNIICMHEAREVVKASQWQSFLNQAIGDVNAMSRTIKRLCIMIISQNIMDISKEIRHTLRYYCKVMRPRRQHTRLYINVLWKDDRDVQQPRLRKRRLSGYIVYPGNKYRRFIPEYIELRRPPKEVTAVFEQHDFEAKSFIIKNKLNKLLNEMRKDMDIEDNKLNIMLDFYMKNQETLSMIAKRTKRKGYKILPNIREMHGLSKEEAIKFEGMLQEKLKQTQAE